MNRELNDHHSEADLLKSVARSSQRNKTKLISFFPKENLEQELIDYLDITTIPMTMTRDQFIEGKNRIEHYLATPVIKKNEIICDGDRLGEYNYYKFTIKRRGDINHDGIEDLIIKTTDGLVKGGADFTFAVTRTKPSGDIVLLKEIESIVIMGGKAVTYNHLNGKYFDENGNLIDKNGNRLYFDKDGNKVDENGYPYGR